MISVWVLLVAGANGLLVPPRKWGGFLKLRPGAVSQTLQQIPVALHRRKTRAPLPATIVRGGAEPKLTLVSAWGALGVAAMLLNAVKRCLPVALEPFKASMSPALWLAYVAVALGMGYAEGYKAFHKKFSPLVVARSMTLPDQPRLHGVFAPAYAMALFHATPKRVATSWGFLVGIFGIVKLVKMLPYPWRSIVDGGVVVGLTIGTVSLFYHYARAVKGIPAPADPSLPKA